VNDRTEKRPKTQRRGESDGRGYVTTLVTDRGEVILNPEVKGLLTNSQLHQMMYDGFI